MYIEQSRLYKNKEFRLRNSRAERGRTCDIFQLARVRILAERFCFIGRNCFFHSQKPPASQVRRFATSVFVSCTPAQNQMPASPSLGFVCGLQKRCPPVCIKPKDILKNLQESSLFRTFFRILSFCSFSFLSSILGFHSFRAFLRPCGILNYRIIGHN